MLSQKTRWNRPFGERPEHFVALRGLWKLWHAALRALERQTDMLLAARFRQDPGSQLPRRRVTHVLSVPAGQLGNPDVIRVSGEPRDATRHSSHTFKMALTEPHVEHPDGAAFARRGSCATLP